MAEWQTLRKLLLEQGVTGEEIAATLQAIDNRSRTTGELDKRASLEAMYDNTLDRLRRDERYADRTEEEIERAAGQYFRNTVKMAATPRGRALMDKLGALEATEYAIDYATIEEAADAAGIEAEVIETQARPMREASPEDVAAGRRVPPSPSFQRAGRPSRVPLGGMRTGGPAPTLPALPSRGPGAVPGALRPSEMTITPQEARSDSMDFPIDYNDSLVGDLSADELLGSINEPEMNFPVDYHEGLTGDMSASQLEDYLSDWDMTPGGLDEGLGARVLAGDVIRDMGPTDLHPRAGAFGLPPDWTENELKHSPGRWLTRPLDTPDSTMDPEVGLPGRRGGAPAGPAAAAPSNVMRLGDTAYVRGEDGEWQAVPDMGGAAERGQAALSADIAAWPNPRDPENARRIAAQAMAQAAGGPSEMVKQAQGDNVAASKDNAAAQQAAAPPSPGKGYSNSEIAGMVVGGAGLAAAIGNTIADFRTTRGLERQLAASAAGDTIARREGALAGSQAQRNIMATSLGRRDISPALALRNAQMTGSRAMSDIYGRAAVESARERRESERQLAEMRKKRWNTLFSGLTQTGATVGSFLTAEGAAQTGAAKRGAGGGNGGR